MIMDTNLNDLNLLDEAYKNVRMASFAIDCLMEKIENEFDLECFERAMAEYKQNGKTYSLDDVEKELGL